MIREFESKEIGKVIYEESFWSGKKRITVNGVVLSKETKTTYMGFINDSLVKVTVVGNFLKGCALFVNDEYFTVSLPAAWYEYVLGLIPFILILVWGNSFELCSIVPVVGGALGGGISGIGSVGSLMLMKKTKNVLLKIAIGLGMLIATFAVCVMLGYAFLSLVN